MPVSWAFAVAQEKVDQMEQGMDFYVKKHIFLCWRRSLEQWKLQNYCLMLHKTLQVEKLQNIFEEGDKDTIKEAIHMCLSWLDKNQLAEKYEFELKQREIKGVVNPIIIKVHVHVCMYYVCMYVCMYVYIYIYIYLCICTSYVRYDTIRYVTYIHTYIHALHNHVHVQVLKKEEEEEEAKRRTSDGTWLSSSVAIAVKREFERIVNPIFMEMAAKEEAEEKETWSAAVARMSSVPVKQTVKPKKKRKNWTAIDDGLDAI